MFKYTRCLGNLKLKYVLKKVHFQGREMVHRVILIQVTFAHNKNLQI